MADTTDLLEDLRWRGLLHQHSDQLAEALRAPLSAYCGFDATGPSLHVGHLIPVMGLVHLQRAGHRPIALVGGGTGMIGDPSGRSSERSLQSRESIAVNAVSIRAQLAHFLDFGGEHAARMRDNSDWLLALGAVDFLRDVGKHFSVNYMLAKESVKSRLDAGISFTEFSYMLLQAYDYLELFRREGVTLQIGGSDQWGNLVAGMELIRRTTGGAAHALTFPLLTTAGGAKFGKTAEGTSIWLDPARTSPYAFYQFWVNADDRDTSRYLRLFTLKSREEIEALDRAIAEHPESREAQRALANDVTSRVHGDAAARTAVEASRFFDKTVPYSQLSAAVFESMRSEIPTLPVTPIDGQVSLPDALTAVGLVSSKGEARRLLQQSGVYVNRERPPAGATSVSASLAIHGRYLVLQKGKQDIALLVIEPAS